MQSSFFEVRPLEVDHGWMLAMTSQRLTEEENLEQFDRDLIALIDTYQARKIVLDLASVSYMTSSAIGKLISLHRRLARNQGRLVICSLQPEVANSLSTSHLLTYFSVAPNPTEACAQLA